MKKFILLILFINFIFAFNTDSSNEVYSEKENYNSLVNNKTIENKWVDSILNEMDLDDKLGQLFMIAAYSNKDKNHQKYIESQIKEHKIGGLIFMQDDPIKQIELTNKYQSLSKLPLMIAIDGEWGLSMRLKNTHSFPKQMTLGAIQDNKMIEEMGAKIAQHCKRMGIHVNFAPVVDVNNNSNNPIINYRSFGENRELVSKLGISYMKGLQNNGVIACAKHFPGHGDTDKDSHLDLPVINHDIQRLDSIEFYPFKELVNNGLMSMMVAHLYIPALDNRTNRATTLSRNVVTGLLKDKMNFKGLIFTDALNMNGVSKFYSPGEVEIEAFKAGNDILLFSADIEKAKKMFRKEIRSGNISIEEIDERVKKILLSKYWLKVNKKSLSKDNLISDLNDEESILLNQKLYDNAITLIKNNHNLLPIKNFNEKKIALIEISNDNNFQMNSIFSANNNVTVYKINKTDYRNNISSILEGIKNKEIVLVHINNTKMKEDYGIDNTVIDIIEQVGKANKKTILNLASNPYSLSKFEKIDDKLNSILVSYENNKYTQKSFYKVLTGEITPKGKLPVTGSKYYIFNTGLNYNEINIENSSPEDQGMDSQKLEEIDKLVEKSIKLKVFPGCQIAICKNGKFVYNKSFGNQTYESENPITNSTIYDIASCTKVVSTTSILMKMYEEGKINLENTLGDYLPEIVNNTDYHNIKLIDILTHQAGLVAWIPFYKYTLEEDQSLSKRIYDTTESVFYNTNVADNIYIHKNYQNTIFNTILNTKISSVKKYKYSDLGYYFIQKIIEKSYKDNLDNIAKNILWSKLGMNYTTYNPLRFYNKSEIAPTEDDKSFRNQLIHGYVHDQGASMLGGIAGHAGVFSNATDLAKLMNMYINSGNYKNFQYVKNETIEYFTKYQFKENNNRRAIGWDKPDYTRKIDITTEEASLLSFGHTGFTGTRIWADPENELVYIFLSNRVYPSADNWKITKENTRIKIEKIIYQSIKEIN